MTLLLILTALAAYLYARHRSRPGAGASAAARARQLDTPTHRLLAAAGIHTQQHQAADRSRAGADGEQRTAALINPLRRRGWTILHDRALPRGRANVDHLAISPQGAVLLPDSKRWSARWRLSTVNGRLMHGRRDVTERLDGLRHEARVVSATLGVPVTPLVVMHGAPVAGGEITLDGIRIVPADRLVPVLHTLGQIPGQRPGRDLAAQADRDLPPYVRAHR